MGYSEDHPLGLTQSTGNPDTVTGNGCHALHSSACCRHTCKLRYQPGALLSLLFIMSHARAPTATGANPAGASKHLFETVTQTSIPHASIFRTSPPRED